ncbi:hypothetical protein Tco_1075369 [Tanacetum coccineum]
MCMHSASIFVLVNGSPSREFKMERDLKQGDPLSHFLFLIVTEALQVLTLEACNKGVYKGLSLAKDGANVSLLQYADDALFLSRLSSWKSNLMSIGGRLTLGGRVNDGSRKMVWINWNKIIMEKDMGGLGVGSIRAKNLSLLGKWIWRFHTENTTLWHKVIKEIYGRDGGFGHMAHQGTHIGLWTEIVKSSSFSMANILLIRIDFPSRSQGAVRALYGACYVLLWSIWRWRNKLLHASSIEVDVCYALVKITINLLCLGYVFRKVID